MSGDESRKPINPTALTLADAAHLLANVGANVGALTLLQLATRTIKLPGPRMASAQLAAIANRPTARQLAGHASRS